MDVYNQEPIQVLWKWFKDLDSKTLKFYKESMNEDEDSVPDSYVVLKTSLNGNPRIFGDGATKLRSSDCDIVLVSKGTASNSKCLHNINKKKIEERLKSLEVTYYDSNLGYDKGLKSTQHVFSVKVIYGS